MSKLFKRWWMRAVIFLLIAPVLAFLLEAIETGLELPDWASLPPAGLVGALLGYWIGSALIAD